MKIKLPQQLTHLDRMKAKHIKVNILYQLQNELIKTLHQYAVIELGELRLEIKFLIFKIIKIDAC